MSAMWGITQYDDVIGPGKLEEFQSIMRAMSVHEEDSGFSVCFLFCLPVEILNHPFHCQLPISPTIWRACNPVVHEHVFYCFNIMVLTTHVQHYYYPTSS